MSVKDIVVHFSLDEKAKWGYEVGREGVEERREGG